jgi:hypothetical protein
LPVDPKTDLFERERLSLNVSFIYPEDPDDRGRKIAGCVSTAISVEPWKQKSRAILKEATRLSFIDPLFSVPAFQQDRLFLHCNKL